MPCIIYVRIVCSCRNGATGENATQNINANAAQSAANAKTQTLPVLQANQDPFGTLTSN